MTRFIKTTHSLQPSTLLQHSIPIKTVHENFSRPISSFVLLIFLLLLLIIMPAVQNDDESSNDDKEEGNVNDNGSVALVPYVQHSPLQEFGKTEKTVSIGGYDFRIHQNYQEHGVAGVIWDASQVLCQYILTKPTLFAGKTVLELGAGTAIPSLASALAGATLTITTDLESAIPVLRKNIQSNVDGLHLDPNRIRIEPYKWGDPFHPLQPGGDGDDFPSIILGADIVYDESVFPELIWTFHHFLSHQTNNKKAEHGSGPQILIACRIRYKRDSNFLLAVQRSQLSLQLIHYDSVKDIYLYRIVLLLTDTDEESNKEEL